jgi:hydroxyethylthiazole kinase-like sugar kinase family protein
VVEPSFLVASEDGTCYGPLQTDPNSTSSSKTATTIEVVVVATGAGAVIQDHSEMNDINNASFFHRKIIAFCCCYC